MFSALASPLLHTFAATTCGKPQLFGLVPWYQYLTIKPDFRGKCSVVGIDTTGQVLGNHSPLLLIGMAILEDLVRIAALVAVGYIIAGGIQYVTSQGAPDATKRAQQTIINALIGVSIAIVAASFVEYLGHTLGS